MGNVNDTSSSGEMTFFEHLDALRPHLVRSALAIFVFFLAAFFSKDFIIDRLLMGPYSDGFPLNRLFARLAEKWDNPALILNNYVIEMINTRIQGQFNMHMKISFVAALVLVIPYTLWELWRFIKPALTPREIAGSRRFVGYISLCFFAGVFFGYFLLVPISLNFFMGYTISPDISNMIDIGSYLSMVVNLSLACGVLFLLPVLIYFLARMGMMTPSFMCKYRRHAFVVLLVFSAIITPPDVFSLILVVIPLYCLYEIGILIAVRVEKQRALKEEEFYSDQENTEKGDEPDEDEPAAE